MINSISVLWLASFSLVFTFPVDDYSVVVLSSYNEPYDGGVSSNGYKFGYELSDGQRRSEVGSILKNSNNEDVLNVEGSYAFNAPEGESFVVSYIANENGYQPRVSRTQPNGVLKQLSGRTGIDYTRFGEGKLDERFAAD